MKHAKFHVRLVSCVAAAAMLLCFAACTGKTGLPEYSYEYDDNKFDVQTITFPENTRGKTDSNAYVYDVRPFTVRFVLPDGWTIKDRPDKNEVYLRAWNDGETGASAFGFSICWIYNGNGDCVGAIGYNTYEEDPEASEEYYFETVYGFTGNHIYFKDDELFETVENGWKNETVLTKTCYDSNYLEPYLGEGQELNYPTILSWLRSQKVCIDFELNGEYADDETVMTIAESFEIVSD